MARRLHGTPARGLLAAVGATAAVGMLAACGTAGDAAHMRNGAVQASAAAARTTAAPSDDHVRVLKEDRTLPVAISPNDVLDIPASSAEVTLTELKQADSLPSDAGLDPEVADPGMTFVCLEMKVQNTGGAEFDTSPLTHARWTGEDGETKNIEPFTNSACAGLGVADENFLNEPDPRPGEFVKATTVLMVPDDQPGYLEFEDGQEFAMFKVETRAAR
ncbi:MULTISPECIES: hypothetical protein [Streptomyces]|uniref:DUF4352 domain-containing protein n=1 Tax=Streptomyces poriferorum TaxID=2798799 RepID=A0ABY9II94_9ACTN|nr:MULTISPECIES: hypothetical protein [unclassified Streptomyces]MDP5316631.1 hypothetical protein [Streptomyces sp. Alt4]TXS44618.1 hypothetical protein EAO72_08375 [Streptomyces sp. or43]WLQ54936.1 hypothetical protein P8A19_05545 [Streptomyces sp. Alt2]